MKIITIFRAAACLIGSIFIVACAADQKTEEAADKDTAPGPRLVGRVASVPADGRFVLIQTFSALKLDQGTVLTSRGPEKRTANLLVTGESLGQFTAADLRAGTAEVGDGVYFHAAPKPVRETSANPPEGAETVQEAGNQEKGTEQNVQKNN